ncbi:MAG: CpaF family protein [Acidimicrobiales bacterium]
MQLSETAFDDLTRRVHEEVSKAREGRRTADAEAGRRPLDHEDLRQLTLALISRSLAGLAKERLGQGLSPIDPDEEQRLVQAVQAMGGLGWAIEELLGDPTVENVNINGYDRGFVHHNDGTKRRLEHPIARSDEELERWVRNAAARMGLSERRFDEGRPHLILRLPDGSRLHAIMSVTRRICLSIRVHRLVDVDLVDMRRMRTVDEPIEGILRAAVRAKLNIIISGGTDAGKTTLLRACLNECPPEDRIVTIEDSYELGIDLLEDRHPDAIAMEEREPNVEGTGAITMRALVREALRMRPDRCSVGEVRGDEILPMLYAMTQGNDGSMCTIHADSAAGVFQRIAMYAVAAPEHLEPRHTATLVAQAVDLIVHLENDGQHRYVSSILEVRGGRDDGEAIATNEVCAPGPDGRAVFANPFSPKTLARLARVGWQPAQARTGAARGANAAGANAAGSNGRGRTR